MTTWSDSWRGGILLFGIFLFWGTAVAYGQTGNQVRDKATLLNKLAWVRHTSEADSGTYWARQALVYALRHRQTEEELVARLQLAEICRAQGDLPAALPELQQGEKLIQRLHLSQYLPRLLLFQGNLALDHAQLDKAEKLYHRGFALLDKGNDPLYVDFCLAFAHTAEERGAGEQARNYLLDAYSRAQQQGDYSREIIALNNLGMQAAGAQAFRDARLYFERSLQLARKYGNLRAQSRACLNIGSLFYYQGDWNSAVASYVQSAAIKAQLHDEAGMAMIHNNIAAIYKEQKRYGKSLQYYEKTSAYYKRSGDSVLLAETWINEAIVRIFMQQSLAGIRLLNQALQLLRHKDLPDVVLTAHTNLAFAYTEMRDYQQAFYYLGIAEKTARDRHDQHSMVFIANLYGANYFFLKAYPKAIDYYRQSYALSRELGLLNEQKKALFGLYEAAQKTGDYQQALGWHEQYTRITDSLFNQESQQQLMALEEKYDTRQKVQQIQHLHARNKTISLENKLTSNQLKVSLLTTALGVFGIIFLGILFYQRSKRQQLRFAHTQERDRERIHQLIQTQEIDLLEMTVQAQQQERRKLAKDIHDNLGSYLATLKYQHEAYQPVPDNSSLSAHYTTTSELIASACAEVRAISHQMAEGADFPFSLVPAVEELIRRIGTAHRFQLHFYHFPPVISLSRECASALYKMIQELFSNILKHAHAEKVELQINQGEHEITVLLEDDGKGFDPASTSGGIGLANIRERLAAFDGKLEINSSPGKGTTTLLFIPLNPTDL